MFIALPAHDHCTYLLIDRTGEVIYVGSSSALFARLGQHAKTKDWWSSVRSISVESFSTVDAMLDRETELIELLDPIHNDLLGTAKALDMASALLGRKITREDVRAYVQAELVTDPSSVNSGPEPVDVSDSWTSLRQYADEAGLDLKTLTRWRERRNDFPSWVGVGARGVQLFDRDHLKDYVRTRLREPVGADE
jgi:hypothetical protein